MLHRVLLTSAIADDPFFFYLSQELAKQFLKITSQTRCYTCIDEGGVYCVAYSTIRFLFFSFSFSAWQLLRDGRGHLWIDVRRESVGLRLPSHTSRCSPLVPSPRSWAKERVGPRWEGGGVGKGDIAWALEPENLLPVKKRRWKPIN